jgi:hypothetical protein
MLGLLGREMSSSPRLRKWIATIDHLSPSRALLTLVIIMKKK